MWGRPSCSGGRKSANAERDRVANEGSLVERRYRVVVVKIVEIRGGGGEVARSAGIPIVKVGRHETSQAQHQIPHYKVSADTVPMREVQVTRLGSEISKVNHSLSRIPTTPTYIYMPTRLIYIPSPVIHLSWYIVLTAAIDEWGAVSTGGQRCTYI